MAALRYALGMSTTNRLGHETSPYLLQHAHNPVDWYAWGAEALERSRSEDKPILLSIGYAACHWCHVMERESFEDEATAALMNEHFVNIKVDREERPDLDEIYMAATVAMSGSGGWPMTVFLTPEQKPFFAGTYFPPTDRYGRPGFKTLLRRIAELWRSDRQSLLVQANALLAQLRERCETVAPAGVGEEALAQAFDDLRAAFDGRQGGFGRAPKFPAPLSIDLLLRQHRRSGDETALAMVRRTLDAMADGGIYDHLGGGFHRYATDDAWLVPHFEKMLYDNAQLARSYGEASQAFTEPRYQRVARETLDYVLREMTSPDGMFFSATDADSEGVEGKFFVWTPEEVEAVLAPEQARAVCAYYDVTPAGNWEGNSILHTPRALDDVARELGVTADALERTLAAARDKLYRARAERVPPLCDDKVLTSWNALMLGALAECGRIFDEPRYRAAAERAADALLVTLRRPDGGLYRTCRAGKAHLDGYLEDYAYLADALVDLYEASGRRRWLEAARDLAERMLADFRDERGGGFFMTAREHEQLIVRMRDAQDGAVPNAAAIAARALSRLAGHLGRSDWREAAESTVRAHGLLVARAPRAFAATLAVVDALLEGPVELVLVGPADDDKLQALRRELGRHYLPNRVIVAVDPAGEPPLAPTELYAEKGLVAGDAALYVCRGLTCKAPVTDPAHVGAALGDARAQALGERGHSLARRLAGRATAEGTRRYAADHATHGEGAFRVLGRTELTTSRLGFGGYRIDEGVDEHAAALRQALLGGCNLVDTSTNYGDGGSERLVGATVAALLSEGRLARDAIVVVSKLGYVQGQNLELARERERRGEPFAEMVRYQDGCWHCIHPSWLADQLTRSLDRLGLETLDVCLLHNPEYFLSDAEQKGGVDEPLRERFYERVARAFAFLEEQVRAGRIGCYGVSSNTIAQGDSADATDLARLLEAARRAGGDHHHFRVLQLPLNLLESRAATESDVLERARNNGLAVLVNRPLNAVLGTHMVRLAETPVPAAGTSLQAALVELGAIERRFASEIAPDVRTEAPAPPADRLLRWAEELASLDDRLESVEQLEHVASLQIVPRISRTLAAIEKAVSGARRSDWVALRGRYIHAVEAALSALRDQAAAKGQRRVSRVRERIDPLLPLARSAEPLSQKALWVLLSTPGVDVVLLGMRRKQWVEDALPVMGWQPLARAIGVYRALDGVEL